MGFHPPDALLTKSFWKHLCKCILSKHQGYLLELDPDPGGSYLPGSGSEKGWTRKMKPVPLLRMLRI